MTNYRNKTMFDGRLCIMDKFDLSFSFLFLVSFFFSTYREEDASNDYRISLDLKGSRHKEDGSLPSGKKRKKIVKENNLMPM